MNNTMSAGMYAMPVSRRYRVLCFMSSLFLVAMIGCRDVEPQPGHQRDLGSNDRLLLPVNSAPQNPRVKDGQAEWQPFRPLGEEPVASAEPEKPGESSADNEELEGEIRELVDEYNGIVGEGDIEGLLEFYTEEQQEAITPLFEAMIEAGKKLGELRGEIDRSAPDAGDGAAGPIGVLQAACTLNLELESITVRSETDVVGKLRRIDARRPIPAEVGFSYVEEYWYLVLPDSDRFGDATTAVKALGGRLDGLLEGLRSGELTGENLAGQLEELAAQWRPADTDTE